MVRSDASLRFYTSIHNVIDQLLQLPQLSLEKNIILRENEKVLLRLKSVEQATNDDREVPCTSEAANTGSRHSLHDDNDTDLHRLPSALDVADVPLASVEREIQNDSSANPRHPSLLTSQPLTWSSAAPLETEVEPLARCGELVQCSSSESSTASTPSSSIHTPTFDAQPQSPPTNSVLVRSTRSSSQANQGKKRKRSQAEETSRFNETFDSIVKLFGAECGLDDLERLVVHAKESKELVPATLLTRMFFSIPSADPNADPMTFVRAVPDLVVEIEDAEFAECLVQIKNRMALAHFYYAYRSAHLNRSMFIEWTEYMGKHTDMQLTPRERRRPDSIVKQRFIDLCTMRSRKTRQQISSDISNWQSWGKQWAELINRFGYAGLLLVPRMMTNDYVHRMPQGKFLDLLDAIEACQARFADSMGNARRAMEKLLTRATTPPADSDASRYAEPNSSNGESGLYLPIIPDETNPEETELPQTIDPAVLIINTNNDTF